MKRLICLFTAFVLVMGCAMSASAEAGKVTYSGDAGEFIFQPGSDYSLTDLFPNFKDVMPGDTLAQPITVRNDASNNVKVEIYIRSLGAHADSVDFLSQLKLKVAKLENNEMAYMFDSYANESAQLTDWVCLGILYSGGEVNLNVILEVPAELGNEYQERIGYLDWEFMIKEYPVEDDDPKPPQTGDTTDIGLLIGLMAGSLAAVIILIVLMIKNRKNDDD